MDAWRGEYPHDVDPEQWLDADGFDRAAREVNMVRLMTADETESFLVAIRDNSVVGFIVVGQPRDEDRPSEPELSALYFDATEFGSGFATELVDAALGERPAYLWVAELNARARRFYAKVGFEGDGARRDTETLFDQAEVRMARASTGGGNRSRPVD
jgi:ribosomal protein S18 acetylase RimI-like enzyme